MFIHSFIYSYIYLVIIKPACGRNILQNKSNITNITRYKEETKLRKQRRRIPK